MKSQADGITIRFFSVILLCYYSNMKKIVFGFAVVTAVCVGFAWSTRAAMAPVPKTYEGIVTQINMSDGSFVMRLRDGRMVTVTSPLASDLFLSVKGVLDEKTNNIDTVTSFQVKDKNGKDAFPAIISMSPATGPVGTKITLTGTAFSKKKNTISIGDIHNALVDLSSKDGKTISFVLPIVPCDQLAKKNCATNVMSIGRYDIAVTTENGVSQGLPFFVTTPLPLAITTETLPQAMGNARYKIEIIGTGGVDNYVWRVSDGHLPTGLSAFQGTCVEAPCKASAMIAGTPTTPGTSEFTMTLSSAGETVSKQFSITVVQPITTHW